MAGAVHYAARAAFGAGAGLVRIATQFGSAAALQENFPDVTVIITMLAGALEDRVGEALEWADAVVLGPGLGRGNERRAFVAEVLRRVKCPVLLDADALHSGLETLQIGVASRVLTPHVGEFKASFPTISGVDADRFGSVAEAANVVAGAKGTVLLKGVPTLIASRDQTRVVASGNPGLATGGSGDVLSGIIGTFLANGLSGLDAASLGAHALGRAAEVAAGRISVRSMRPTDVIHSLAEVWKGLAEPVYKEPPVMLDLRMPVLK
jgi:NAD(P)H-hydrate epimerase